MANNIYIPRLNPVSFYDRNPNQPLQYSSRHMDDWMFENQHESHAAYRQKWTVHDNVRFQFESNFAAIQLNVIDCNEQVIVTHNAVQRKINKFIPGYYVYEINFSMGSLTPGVYWFQLVLGGTKKMISEPQEVAEELPNTMLFEYFNSRFHGDVLFETNIRFSFRVEMLMRKFEPGTESTMYRDQRLNPTVLTSTPFRSWELYIGRKSGVPDWVAERINWIFSCDNVLIDGKPYAVLDDSTLEPLENDPGYPLRVFTMQVQEGINRASKIVGVDIDISKKLLIGLPLDSTIHGDLSENAGSSIVIIQGVE